MRRDLAAFEEDANNHLNSYSKKKIHKFIRYTGLV